MPPPHSRNARLLFQLWLPAAGLNRVGAIPNRIHLGLTCDPICGLVQIPCIERNAVAAKRAMDAFNLSGLLCGSRNISFDMVVRTMKETGLHISAKYRETSEGGLAKLYDRRAAN